MFKILTAVSFMEKLIIIVSTLMLAQYQYLLSFYCIFIALLLQVSQLFYFVSLYIESDSIWHLGVHLSSHTPPYLI